MSQVRFIPSDEEFSDETPIPRGRDVLYECLRCGDIIPSLPPDNLGCKCDNVFIDIDAFRILIEDYTKFRLVRKVRA